MMQRILRTPEQEAFDLSSLRVLMHMAAPCPEWVKRAWIERIGPEQVLELWAATELTGITLIRGDEWLTHPGSVGRPMATEVRILGEDGAELPVGEVGEIYSRMLTPGPSYAYLGSDPLPEVEGGFRSVGDLGHLDADGYLYLDDRRTDLIITGGANVYPAEVEAVLSAHPGVEDVVVIGLADPDLGRRVHALVQPRDPGQAAHLRGAGRALPRAARRLQGAPHLGAGRRAPPPAQRQDPPQRPARRARRLTVRMPAMDARTLHDDAVGRRHAQRPDPAGRPLRPPRAARRTSREFWLPELRAGGVDVQVLPICLDEQFQSEGGLRRTLLLVERIHELAAEHADDVAVCLTGADVDAATAAGRIALDHRPGGRARHRPGPAADPHDGAGSACASCRWRTGAARSWPTAAASTTRRAAA